MTLFDIQGSVLDNEPFPLPLSGLFADFSIGKGLVALSDEFKGLPGATKLAVIADWQEGIEKERRLAIVTLFREVTDVMGIVAMPQKLVRFRNVCAQIGVDCPTDIAILLQQI